MMKTALIIESIILVALVVILAVKWRKWAVSEVQQTEFEISPGDTPLDRHVLEELGFKIYDTKSTIYALNTDGISLTYVEGSEWVADIRGKVGRNKGRSIKHIYTVGELIDMADEFDKKIYVKDND